MTERETDRIIEMAWEDRTPFGAIYHQFGVSEKDVIKIMRRNLKGSGFRRWRKRVQGRKTKHKALRTKDNHRFRASRQKAISNNQIT